MSGYHYSDAVWVGSVVVLFLLAVAVLPMEAPPLLDEPIFAASAFEWARSGRIQISGLSAPIAVFDTIWGGLFARVLDPTYEALRWSTVALVVVSAPFFHWLLRQLNARPSVAALGVSAYLFNPLALVLSVTFMTDIRAAALATISAALFLRAIRDKHPSPIWLAVGSAVASIGYLSRQQVLVIPIAAFIVLTICSARHKTGWNWPIPLIVPPAFVYIGYELLTSDQEIPFIRTLSEQALMTRFFSEIGTFTGIAIIMAVVYTGIVVLPLAPLLTPGSLSRGRLPTFILTVGISMVGLLSVLVGRDPTSNQTWLSQTGFASVDRGHLGERPDIWPDFAQTAILLLATAATVLLARAVTSTWPARLMRMRLFLVASIGGFIGTAVLASMTVHRGIHDRYWTPIVPLTVALVVGASKASTRQVWLSAIVMSAIALFGWFGTRDGLLAQQEIVAFANASVEAGIDPLEFEGGASWSALTFGLADDDGPTHILSRSGPFWVKFYAVETEPIYGITLEPLDGYRILGRRELPSILNLKPIYMYLVERDSETGYFIREDDF